MLKEGAARAVRTMLLVAALAFSMEVLIMTLLSRWGLAAGSLRVILFDGAVLALSIAPAIYWLVLAPLEREHSKRAQAEDYVGALDQLATIDPHLGIPNRRATSTRLQEEMVRAQRYGAPLCVAWLRLSNYRNIVEIEGPEVGDKILSKATLLVRRALRLPDYLGRVRSQALLLILPESDLDEAQATCARIHSQITDSGIKLDLGISQFEYGEDPGAFVSRAELSARPPKEINGDPTQP